MPSRVPSSARASALVPPVAMVALAAALWGTDGLFRSGLALELPAATVVFYEHLLLVAAVSPLLPRVARAARGFGAREWLAVVGIGAGASAVATMLFTAAFRYGDVTTPLLLQKLQPLLAMLLARILLGERLRPRYAWFAGGAIAGAWMISFADPLGVSADAATAAALAVGAAALWAAGTVLGRYLSGKVTATELTALRFAVGLPAAGIIALVDVGVPGLAITGSDVGALVLLALVPGLLAILLYYRGLAGTPASAATLAELAFPLTAVALNRLVFDERLTGTQWLGVLLLSGTLVVMSQLRDPRALGVEQLRAEPQPAG